MKAPFRSLRLALAICLLSASGAPAQILTVTDGLQLWLKADAGTTTNGTGGVTSWLDQTTNHNDAVANDDSVAPQLVANALNGKPVLRFDGASVGPDHLDIPDSDSLSFTGDMTTFFVVRFSDFATYRAVWAKTAVNFPGPTDWYALPTSGIPRLLRGNGTNLNFASSDGVALKAGTYLTVGFDVEGTSVNHYLAAQRTAGGTMPTAVIADSDTSLIIGSRADLVTKMKGDIAEIVIYDRTLTSVERAAVVAYLGQKYNIQNLPPTATVTTAPVGPSVPAGTTVTLNATANDPDGSVARIEFLVNGTLMATAIAPPYSAKVRLETASSYVVTARAVDDKDATGTSLPKTLTVPDPGGTPTLGVLANLQLWMKADAGVTTGGGGEVTGWDDQSGNANHAGQFDPSLSPTVAAAAINGRPALHFDGVDDYLEVPDSDSVSITGDLTSYFVVRMADFATYRAVWAKGFNNLPAPTDFYLLPSSGVPRLFRGDGTAGGIANLDAAQGWRANAFEMAGFSSAGATTTHYLNGRPNGTGTIATTNADLDTPLEIGTRADFVTRLSGDLAELLIYDAAHSEADRRTVELYLAQKYAVALATPLNDPPTALLTAPVAGSSFVAPTDITLTATATDADGGIARVEFLVNGSVAATDTTAPYSASVNFPIGIPRELRARAIDNLGLVTESAPVAITLTSAQQIPLPAVPHLRLWLKGDAGVAQTGGLVSQWNDQSGNLNNAIQPQGPAQPAFVSAALNGKPVLRFDGVDDYLSVANSSTVAIQGDISTFFVVNCDDFDTYRTVWAKTAGNQPRSTDFYTLPNSGLPNVLRGGTAGIQAVTGTLPLTAGEFAIVAFDQGGTTMRHYLNGAPNGEGEITAALEDVGTPLLIGTRADFVTQMKGDVAEIVIYDSSLSNAELDQTFAYLGAKYGIPVTSTGELPVLTITVAGNDVTVSWPAAVTGWTLRASVSLASGSWQDVPDVVSNSVTQPVTGTRFYRLEK